MQKLGTSNQIRSAVPGSGFTIAFTGDCCPRNLAADCFSRESIYNTFAEIKSCLTDVDLRIMQWETPVGTIEAPIHKSGPNILCSPQSVMVLKELNIDIALLANNHIGDHGPQAVEETIERLETAGIKTVGAGKNLNAAEKPLTIKLKDKKITLINCAENEFGIADADTAGCAHLAPFKNIDAIKRAREKSDFVIVAIHGGHEFNPLPSPRMVELYRNFADAGADVVFNCHTHCPEPVEIWNGTPIIYSPGNFYFPSQSRSIPNIWYHGYIPILHFDNRGVFRYEIVPYHFDSNRIYKLSKKQETNFFRVMNNMAEHLIDPVINQKYFDTWCMEFGGPMYLRSLLGNAGKIRFDQFSCNAENPEWLDIKNIFNCESHNDMLSRALKLLVEEKSEIDDEVVQEIKEFQHARMLM